MRDHLKLFIFFSFALIICSTTVIQTNCAAEESPPKESSLNQSIEKTYSKHYPAVVGIAPDGSQLLLKSLSLDAFSLDLYNPINTKTTTINRDQYGQFAIKWSSDGKKVAFFLDPGGKQDFKLNIYDIDSAKTESFKHRRITNPQIAWSKNSQFLAYLDKSRNLVIIDLKNKEQEIYQSKEEVSPRSDFAWSDTSSAIAFVLNSKPNHIQVQEVELKTEYEIKTPGRISALNWLHGKNKLIAAYLASDFAQILEIDKSSANSFNISISGDVTNLFSSDSFIAFTQTNGVNVNSVSYDRNIGLTLQKEGSIITTDCAKNIVYANLVNFDSSKIVAIDLNTKAEKILLSQNKGSFKNYTIEEPFIRGPSRKIPVLLWKAAGVEDRPVLLMIHGGPHLNYTKSWRPELEVLLENGIDVMQLNYSGSSGYGAKYLSQVKIAIPDILKTVNYLSRKRKYKKIFIYADSYGSSLAVQAANLINSKLSGLIISSFYGNLRGSSLIPKKVLAFQGENDYICSPECAESALTKHWDTKNQNWLKVISKEGHSFHRINTWSYVFREIINFIN